MKVIQINCVYKEGSTGKIAYDIHRHLKNNGIQSLVLYGRGKQVREDNVWKVSSELEAKIHSVATHMSGIDFAFSAISTRRVINFLEREKPDAVHLHCLNGHFINVYKLLNYLKQNHVNTVLTLHAEIMHTAGCEHAMQCEKWKEECFDCDIIAGKITHFFRDDAKHSYRLMKHAMANFNELIVVGVSDWLTDRAKQSKIFKNSGCQFVTIKNGLDTQVFCPSPYEVLRKELGLYNEPVILHVTPSFMHPIKGGKYVIELAKNHPEWKFVIVGFEGDRNLLPHNVIAVSHVGNQNKLAQYYSMADITLLTSQRETFSMVCAESLCCGTPVVGFEAGGPETIAISEYSKFVEQGCIKQLEDAIQEILTKKVIVDDVLTRRIYDSETMAQSYLQLYKGIGYEN